MSEASEEVATRFVVGIEQHFEPLLHFPLIGPARGYLAPGLRVTFHKPYAIYYAAVSDTLLIVRVIHGARDVGALAERGGFGLFNPDRV